MGKFTTHWGHVNDDPIDEQTWWTSVTHEETAGTKWLKSLMY